MKGYIMTNGGEEYELPVLLEWQISRTGNVPCDSFALRCPYEAAMAQTLRRAVRFTAREEGKIAFAGVIDECEAECGRDGLTLEISGRGMAALLLDNEAEAATYQRATMREILKNHVTPFGVRCAAWDGAETAGFRVANGASQWKGLHDFAALRAGIEPYFHRDGTLEVKRERARGCVTIDERTPVTALRYRDRRYGVIAEALVVNRKTGVRQRVRNEAFLARGGTSRRVFYMPAGSGTQTMRCTGEYQIERSKADAETLRVTIAGRFDAEPGDRAEVKETRLGVSGQFRVKEAARRFDSGGETSELVLQRE